MKNKIQTALQNFQHGDFPENALALFKTLGYNTERQNRLADKTLAGFNAAFPALDSDKAKTADWQTVDVLFQLTSEEMTASPLKDWQSLNGKPINDTIIESYLFFALELSKTDYTRSELANIAREFNKIFPMPVLLLCKHGNKLSLAVVHRRLHKLNADKDVLEKVTLIKDIQSQNPHRAHLEILHDLTLTKLRDTHHFTNFVELHNAWQKTLDTNALNKRFYKELSQWYFWAMKQVYFPDAEADALKGGVFADPEKVREHNAKNLIRLLTRLLFVWFIKEKQLIPEQLFSEHWLKDQLKHFNPHPTTLASQGNDSHYYRAILQNLFFATLNQTRGKREFRKDGQHRNITNLLRYQNYFHDPEAFIHLLEAVVPFMNGGLFECLDKVIPEQKGRHGGDVIAYEDGFSDRPDNTLKVPDFIFFGTHKHIDLSAELGSKNKSVDIKGLIDLLQSYKFTISENTPIEQDIALDPELLGQVFENLLASYNPETGVTARKQTGSFYTPREIVNYMIDESLLAYFSNLSGFSQLNLSGLEDLKGLLSYNATGNPFNASETQTLIHAIDNCKILDPACGSGAFPMGILHKLVHCLHKLDPDNQHWQTLQHDKILHDTQTAIRIEDNKELSEKLKEINNAFDSAVNYPDYARKLFLIENCIYGIDIQAIAIQISKLRFFISLVVDQIVNPDKNNFGILPLPNLETKFVAANTLIGIDKAKAQCSLFDNTDVEAVEAQLKAVRHSLFSAKTPKTKRELRAKDEALREKIGALLIQDGWQENTASRLAAWNPYDQNASSGFFDSEWMFGLNDGFDVVIGNPPYIQIQKFSGQQCQRDWQAQNYATFEKTGDIYALFIEKGISLLNQKGLLAFITSNKWMRAGYGKSLREFLATKTQPLQLIDFGDSQLFENATTYTDILITQNNLNAMTGSPLRTASHQNPFNACTIENDFSIEIPLADYFAAHKQTMPVMSKDAWVISSGIEQHIKTKIEAIGTPLKDWDVNIYRGILTGFNEAFIIDTETKERLCAEDAKSAKIIKPILRGRDIKRYAAEWAGLWLINSHNNPPVNIENYPAIKKHLDAYCLQLEKRGDKGLTPFNLRNCAYIKEFEQKKIVWLEMSPLSNFTIDTDNAIVLNTAYILTGDYIKYLLSVINSKVIDFYFLTISTEVRGGTRRYTKQYVEQIPIPEIPESEQQPFITLVDQILADKKTGKDTSALENESDQLVYALYGLNEDEIKIIKGEK